MGSGGGGRLAKLVNKLAGKTPSPKAMAAGMGKRKPGKSGLQVMAAKARRY